MNCVGVVDDFLDTLGDQTKKMSRLEIAYSSISSRIGALDLTIHHSTVLFLLTLADMVSSIRNKLPICSVC